MSTSTERISGHFTADSIEHAVRQAREWAEAEPNIESYEIVSIEAVKRESRSWMWAPIGLWDATWDIVFRDNGGPPTD